MFSISIPNDNFNPRSRLLRGLDRDDLEEMLDFELEEDLDLYDPSFLQPQNPTTFNAFSLMNVLKPLKPKLKKQSMTTKLYVKNDNTKKLEAPTCCICLTALKLKEDVCKLPCQHIFHFKCLDKWVETKQECPYCRGKIEEEKGTDKKKKK